MAVIEQKLTKRYALYRGDAIEIMRSLHPGSVHLSLYSPPFAGLYQYSSDPRDLSNCINRDEFFQHYEYAIREIHRVTLPGRMSAVHCTDIPTGNTGLDHLMDLPGDIIRLHEKCEFQYVARYHIWKEPLMVRNRTMTKSLSHKSVTIDSTRCSIANADYLLIFRRSGKNPIPVAHPNGLTEYAGERQMPSDAAEYKGWDGSQLENKYSHWIWRQYASAFWDDIRIDRVLFHKPARDAEDERHVHPLQLDVIDRALVLWSNPGEVVLSPFMGVGSEIYGAVRGNRLGIGIELKESYFKQAVKNLEQVNVRGDQIEFALGENGLTGGWDDAEDD
jgi:DNA modification methylase